jgi:hypothetical protein
MVLRSLLLLMLAVAMAACSPSEPPETAIGGAAKPAAPAVQAPAAKPPSEAPKVTAAEKAFADYAPMGDEPLAWVGQYYAATANAVEYPALAQRLDATYRDATDTFAKRDALDAFRRLVDQAIATAKANPYIRIPPYQTQLGSYDLDRARYDLGPLLSPDNVLDVGSGAAQVRFAPAGPLANYAPASEAEARAAEKTLSTEPFPRKVQVAVFGKVVGGELRGGMPSLLVLPARVELTTFPLNGPALPVLTATVP